VNKLRLSICVVLYESAAVTRRFHTELIESLRNFDSFELLYYDNSATNTLARWFGTMPESALVSYQHDPRNLGFSFANNELILRARYERILLLNPDVFGLNDSHWRRIAALETAGVARFARLLNADGSFQDCIGDVASWRRALTRGADHSTRREEAEVGMGIMAFMLCDKHVFASVGLLDCDYPLYAEDMDWCYRARRRGVRVLYDPTIELTHLGGASAKSRWAAQQTQRRKYQAERIFIDKHYRGLHWLSMRLLNASKLVLRGGGIVLRDRV